MSIPKKLDHETALQLRAILSRLNVIQNRVTIDLDKETFETDDDNSIDDILESAGVLTAEQAKDLMKEVQKIREDDWN